VDCRLDVVWAASQVVLQGKIESSGREKSRATRRGTAPCNKRKAAAGDEADDRTTMAVETGSKVVHASGNAVLAGGKAVLTAGGESETWLARFGE